MLISALSLDPTGEEAFGSIGYPDPSRSWRRGFVRASSQSVCSIGMYRCRAGHVEDSRSVGSIKGEEDQLGNASLHDVDETHLFSLNSAWAAASAMTSRFLRRRSCVGSILKGMKCPDRELRKGGVAEMDSWRTVCLSPGAKGRSCRCALLLSRDLDNEAVEEAVVYGQDGMPNRKSCKVWRG